VKKFIFVRLGVCFLALINHASAFSMNSLPAELKISILSRCYNNNANEAIAVNNIMHRVIKLQKTCKDFQQALTCEVVSGLFARFSDDTKTSFLDKIIVHNNNHERNKYSDEAWSYIPSYYYSSKSFFAVCVILGGGKLEEFAHNKLVNSAFHYNDTALISLLCTEDKINLNNLHWHKAPLFFYICTVEMAKICEKKVNFHTITANDSFYPNILWRATFNKDIPSELLNFYLEKEIAIVSRPSDGQSLLHLLSLTTKYATADTNLLNKVKLLLAKNPDLINDLNKDKKTPLDSAIDVLASIRFVDLILDSTECTKEYIKLLKEHGGKTSKELSASCNKPEECILF